MNSLNLNFDHILSQLSDTAIDDNNIFIIRKMNWEYENYLRFCNDAVLFLKENPKKIILIFCSHPHCFTHGRGLQRNKGLTQDLLAFNPAIKLPCPLHNINRGGGLTFHYPGQLIIYPMINFNFFKKNLARMMVEMLQLTAKILNSQFNVSELTEKNELLGLWWKNEKKLASIGMGLDHFVTTHGLAINLRKDVMMFNHLAQTSPCGINGNIYSNFEDLLNRQINDLELSEICDQLAQHFLKLFNKKSNS